ncbi:MAG: hypothetical protein HQ534_02500, partial [Armatimonadetes bacterium]|nr:hypothetical protein [Armatimonadota bacterium]
MGTIYDKYKGQPDHLGAYIHIKYKDPTTGKWKPKPIGRVKPKDLTKTEYRRRVKELKQQARDILAKIEGDVVSGKYGLRDESGEHDPIFAEVALPWVDGRTNRSARSDQARLRNHVEPYFGAMHLSEITPGVVREFIDHMDARFKVRARAAAKAA